MKVVVAGAGGDRWPVPRRRRIPATCSLLSDSGLPPDAGGRNVATMDLIARLKGLRRSTDDKLAKETLEARAAGVEHETGMAGLGAGAEFERVTDKLEHAEEHQEPR